MITIAGFKFPETHEEVEQWEPYITYTALSSTVLLVAKTRIEGNWSCYCTPVPGKSHEEEKHLWRGDGTKVRASIAYAAFPQFDELPYDF